MTCHGFKGGIGTASRVLPQDAAATRSACWCSATTAARSELRVAGVPVGEEIADLTPCISIDRPASPSTSPPLHAAPTPMPRRCRRRLDHHRRRHRRAGAAASAASASRRARRSASGAWAARARTRRATSSSRSPPRIPAPAREQGRRHVSTCCRTTASTPLFYATVQATEEAILNAMLAAETMTGADGLRVFALPHDRLMAAMRKYGASNDFVSPAVGANAHPNVLSSFVGSPTAVSGPRHGAKAPTSEFA